MKKLISRLLTPLFIVGMVVAPMVPVYTASAADGAFEACGSVDSPVCASKDNTEVNTIIQTIVNTLLFVLGVIAVIMIVIGGIRYTTSNGDASAVKGAKDTILYAVVGLVVAIMAYAIVNFVLGRF